VKVGGRRETVHIQPGQGEQANRRILCISENSQEQKTREYGQEEQKGTEDKKDQANGEQLGTGEQKDSLHP